jgi:predicted dehydrogenase
MKKIRLGVIGIGTMGRSHLNKLPMMKNVELTAVCDIVGERALKAAAEYRCPAYTDYRTLLRDKVCDAVLVVTPHYSHTPIGIAALKAGLHVLVEKPISVHKADCERLIAAHTGRKQVFSAMFNQRTDPRYRKLKEWVQDGTLGKIDRITWIITDWFRTDTYYASSTWRSTWAGEGGGVLLNQATHNLDLWQWIFGMPQHVRGLCKFGRKHAIEVEDEITATFDYDSGCTGVLIASTGEAPGTNRLEVAAENGKVVIEGNTFQFIRNETPATRFIRTSKDPWEKPGVWEISVPVRGTGGQHKEILQNFIDAIVDHAPLISPATEGIRAVELGNAILYSSEHDRTVDLPLDAKAYARLLKRKIRESRFVKRNGAINVDTITRPY